MLVLSMCAASMALVPRYSSSGLSRPSLTKPASQLSLRRSAVVRLALDPAGADPVDTTAAEPAQQAWPEPAFSVAELQAKEDARIEAAEAATRETAVPLTDEGGAFSVVALVTVCGLCRKQGGTGFGQALRGFLSTPDRAPGYQRRQPASVYQPVGLRWPATQALLSTQVLVSFVGYLTLTLTLALILTRCWSSLWAASCSSRASRAPG